MKPPTGSGGVACRIALFILIGLVSVNGQVVAQEETTTAADNVSSKASASDATTISDTKLPVDHLQVVLRPLTRVQLEAELEGWLGLLSAKVKEVGETEIALKADVEGESAAALKEQLVELRKQELEIIERVRTVLTALEAKGGDVETAQQFVAAVSDISETTDATSYWAAIVANVTNWFGRDDGGIMWLKRATTATAILLVFWMISKFAGKLTARAIARHPRTSVLLENFARRTTGGIVFVVGALMALAALGVQIGPLMAALGAGGFIVGFALQETLGSFASGMMIMIYRPFDVDDYVSVADVEGTVKEMSLVSTTLLTVDNKVLVIPNKKAWSDIIVNYTGRDMRRIDLVFGIGYDDDIQHAVDVLTEITNEHKLVLAEPKVMVHVDALADSSVNLFCRPWVKTTDYWAVRWDITRQVKERFDLEGISIPYPQQDLHMHNESVPS